MPACPCCEEAAYFVVLPLVLPLAEPLVPAPALPLVEPGLVLEPESLLELLGLEELRSVELLELEPVGGFTLMSVLLDEDEGRSVLAPADELPGLTLDEDDEPGDAGVVVVAEDEEDVPGRAEDPVVLFLLSPQALNAVATAATIASFAKFRKVLSIYTLLLWLNKRRRLAKRALEEAMDRRDNSASGKQSTCRHDPAANQRSSSASRGKGDRID